MKRRQLIAAALCLIMLTTVGAGIVAAKQTGNPRHAGASPIYTYDVGATDSHGTGKLMIDVKQGRFVFNGKEFTPDKTYALFDTTTSRGIHVLATGKATSSGNIHLAGTWEKDAVLPSASNVGASAGIIMLQRGSVAIGPLTHFSGPDSTSSTSYYTFESTEYGTFAIDAPPGDTGGAYVNHQATVTVDHFQSITGGAVDILKIYANVVISGDGAQYSTTMRPL